MTTTTNIMLDLETYGTRPGCIILSIGMAAFTPQGLITGDTFYRVIDFQSCVDAGLTSDPGTMKWWGEQTREVQQTLHAAMDIMGGRDGSIGRRVDPLGMVLNHARLFIKNHFGDVTIWGNGADFDNPILAVAYQRAGFGAPPWQPYAGRCYRTLKNLLPYVPKPVRRGVHHNALDDAEWQAIHAAALLTELERLTAPDRITLPILPLVPSVP